MSLQSSLLSNDNEPHSDGNSSTTGEEKRCGIVGRAWRKMGLTLQTVLSVVVGVLIGLAVRKEDDSRTPETSDPSLWSPGFRNCTPQLVDLVAFDKSTSDMFYCDGSSFVALQGPSVRTEDWMLILAYPGNLFLNALKLLCVPFVFVSMVQADLIAAVARPQLCAD